MNWFNADLPAGWADLIVRTVKVAVVAFVLLQLKEWFDAGALDTPGTAADAALVAGGTFVLNAILMRFKSRPAASSAVRGAGNLPDTNSPG